MDNDWRSIAKFILVYLVIAGTLLVVLPIASFLVSIWPRDGDCAVALLASEAAPDGTKSVRTEEKECGYGFGLTDEFIDIVIMPTTPDAREEQILRIQIPENRDALRAHWAGNHLLVIDRPKEKLKQEIRYWSPSVRVVIR